MRATYNRYVDAWEHIRTAATPLSLIYMRGLLLKKAQEGKLDFHIYLIGNNWIAFTPSIDLLDISLPFYHFLFTHKLFCVDVHRGTLP